MASHPPKYDKQRAERTPPHAPLQAVRKAAHLTLEEVCERMSEQMGKPFSKGALSGIENGHRGASAETLRALEVALDLYPGALTTTYVPETNTRRHIGIEAKAS